MEDLELLGACALNTIFGYEPRIAHGIADNLGSFSAVFSLPRERKDELFGPYSKYARLVGPKALDDAAAEIRRIKEIGCRFVTVADPDYPALLRECEDAPIGLYVRGDSADSNLFNCRPAVAIVGTRDCSFYGKEWCEKIVCTLACAPTPPLIVSGLAFGVDISAHMAALGCNLPTVAVMPGGLDDVYPRRHSAAAARIASTPGCALVTDYPLGTSPVAFTFLRRNRIIAGMSSSTILVESKIRGGGLITAGFAFDYGRDVFVLPGRIDDPRSAGCNKLLKEKTAEPITGLEELAAQLGLGVVNRRRREDLAALVSRTFSADLPPAKVDELVRITKLIKAFRGISLEELCRKTELGYSEVSSDVGLLENEGIVDLDLLQRCTIHVKNA